MWKKLTGLGMLGVSFYVLHVVLGGILWKGYDHLQQAISDLTASGAPNRGLITAITVIYGVLCILCLIAACVYTRGRIPKIAWAGIAVFLAMHLVSITYSLFPEDLAGSSMTFLGLMHIVVTALVVPLTILAPILVGVGFLRSPALKTFAVYSIVTGIFIFFAGGATAMFAAQKLPYFGLMERINMTGVQLWMFLLSLTLFRKGFDPDKLTWSTGRK